MKKTLIAASVGALMLAAAGTASANSLLFPFFTTAGGASSSVSLSSNANAETLHYVYNYNDGKDACAHFDQNGSLTANDLMQHSIARPADGGFGMAAPGDTSKPVYLPVKNTQGFLTVTSKSALAKAISGDMLLVDPATNLVFSYAGISNDLDTSVAANEGNFAALPALEGKKFNLSIYPTGAVNTSWYALVTGDMSAAITAAAPWDAAASLDITSAFDNDEHPSSGKKTTKFVCAGNVTAANLMTGAQYQSIAANGGMAQATASFVKPLTSVYAGDNLTMYKIQIATAAVAAPLTNKVFIHRENGAAF